MGDKVFNPTIESRKNFADEQLNYKRMDETLSFVIGHLSLSDILKLVREVSYDMVRYDSEDVKGVVYGRGFDEEHILQTTNLQRRLRDMCDLFDQSVKGHKFDESYLERFSLVYEVESYKNKAEYWKNEYEKLKEETEMAW